MDGCRTTSDMLAEGLAVYDELDGLNVGARRIPGEQQTLAPCRGIMLGPSLGSCPQRCSV